ILFSLAPPLGVVTIPAAFGCFHPYAPLKETLLAGLPKLPRFAKPSLRPSRMRPRDHLSLEELESRTLLSRTGWARLAAPPATHGQLAATNPTPPGFQPNQIRHAYGMDLINFGTSKAPIQATGAGQTIAIVDAYNDPNIAGDLAQFSTQFSLPKF